MRRIKLLAAMLFLLCAGAAKAGILKSVVYDFDGFDDGMTDLPEGDYRINDLTYKAVATPPGGGDMLGDRALELDLNWNAGNGAFGRAICRFIQFDPAADVFNFYFYNPGLADVSFDVALGDDDDGSNSFSISNDDLWLKTVTVPGGAGWQLISIPLSQFMDSNPGGNGVFDISFDGGMLLLTEFRFHRNTAAQSSVFYVDMICFSDGSLPVGATPFSLPPLSMAGKCPLGAYEKKPIGTQDVIPQEIEGLFAEPKKIRYVNWFLQFAMDGSTTAGALPGDEVTRLLSNGYQPIITWEALFMGYDRLDPRQPKLSNIINGDFDGYIGSFADKIKSYGDTVIIRFMHEFEGNWYPWSLTYNDTSPAKYVQAYRKVVDLFRARGATNVKWMWCLNSDYAPYQKYNWSVRAYPGDNYVDIVATDIYNNHFPVNSPWWYSFRYKAAESYYYLTKYFPNKPLMICEVGCRERSPAEVPGSETKAQWLARMDMELQSDFSRAKGLVFFSSLAECDWRINSSAASVNSIHDNIWTDDYYFDGSRISHTHDIDYADGGFVIYPNPTSGWFTLEYCFHGGGENVVNVEIVNATGDVIFQKQLIKNASCGKETLSLGQDIPRGIYLINVTVGAKKESKRVILSFNKFDNSSAICVNKSGP